jgi:hypothetical protein
VIFGGRNCGEMNIVGSGGLGAGLPTVGIVEHKRRQSITATPPAGIHRSVRIAAN